jgi:hypothetical protein
MAEDGDIQRSIAERLMIKAAFAGNVEEYKEHMLKRILNFIERVSDGMVQRSPEWYAIRTTGTRIGGSEISCLLGWNKYKKRSEMLLEKAFPTDSDPVGAACWWGTMFEPVITRFVELDLNCTVVGDEICMRTPARGHFNSPDGFGVVTIYRDSNGDVFPMTVSNVYEMECGPEDGAVIVDTWYESVLFEFKCPYRRVPKDVVPHNYLPQVWSGLDTAALCDRALFVDGAFKKCPIDSLKIGHRGYDFEYHNKQRSYPGRPVALGIIRVLVPTGHVWATQIRRKLLGFGCNDDTVMEHTILMDMLEDEDSAAGHGIVDLGGTGIDDFDAILKCIDTKEFMIEYIDPYFYHERCGITTREELIARAYIPSAYTDKELFGIIPWKAFDVQYIPVDRRQNFLKNMEPAIEFALKQVQQLKGAENAREKAAVMRDVREYDGKMNIRDL